MVDKARAESTTGATQKRVVGRPFQKGQSGNPSGRPRNVFTQALHNGVTPEIAAQITQQLIDLALSGDLKAIEVLLDRIEGKAVARQEQGKPGEFDALAPLAELSTDELRALIRPVPSPSKRAKAMPHGGQS